MGAFFCILQQIASNFNFFDEQSSHIHSQLRVFSLPLIKTESFDREKERQPQYCTAVFLFPRLFGVSRCASACFWRFRIFSSSKLPVFLWGKGAILQTDAGNYGDSFLFYAREICSFRLGFLLATLFLFPFWFDVILFIYVIYKTSVWSSVRITAIHAALLQTFPFFVLFPRTLVYFRQFLL